MNQLAKRFGFGFGGLSSMATGVTLLRRRTRWRRSSSLRGNRRSELWRCCRPTRPPAGETKLLPSCKRPSPSIPTPSRRSRSIPFTTRCAATPAFRNCCVALAWPTTRRHHLPKAIDKHSSVWREFGLRTRALCRRMSRVLLQNFVEGRQEEVRVGFGKDERRAEFEDVVMRAICAREYSALAQTVNDIRSLVGSGRARLAIKNEVETEKESGAADVADKRVLLLQECQLRDQMISDA